MSDTSPARDGYPIDVLAARAGMTVRNVRAHLSRGLLPAGEMRGRTAWYGPEHLARLDLIAGLQRRGFSLAAIGVLINQTPSSSAEEALRLYRGMLAPWQPEEPIEIADDEFAGWVGAPPPPGVLDRLAAANLVERPGDGRIRILNPSLVLAAAQATTLGLGAPAVGDVIEELRVRTREVADLFVALFADEVWRSHVEAGLPRSGLTDLRTAVEALQPVATRALLGAFRQTMQESMDEFIRRLSRDLAPEPDPVPDADPVPDRPR